MEWAGVEWVGVGWGVVGCGGVGWARVGWGWLAAQPACGEVAMLTMYGVKDV